MATDSDDTIRTAIGASAGMEAFAATQRETGARLAADALAASGVAESARKVSEAVKASIDASGLGERLRVSRLPNSNRFADAIAASNAGRVAAGFAASDRIQLSGRVVPRATVAPDFRDIKPVEIPPDPGYETNKLLRRLLEQSEQDLVDAEQDRTEQRQSRKRERIYWAIGLAVSVALGVPGWIALLA